MQEACQALVKRVNFSSNALSRLDKATRVSGVLAGARRWGIHTTSVGAAAEIKQKLDLVEYIGETVQLRKAGTTFKGLCPFHGEKTPSFVVTPARETWHCFGCGRGGDLFSFAMERDGLDFPTALRQLAGRAGVEISERTSRDDARRKRLHEALEAAVTFYHRVLTDHASGQAALDYLRSRGFTDDTIEGFQLGWAPDSWDALTRALTSRRGMTESDLEASGLVSRRQGGASSANRRGVYDRFRARIMFPIRDPQGHATGFGGRVLGGQQPGPDQGPKYLNTPATALFDKSRTLYLIDKSKSAMKKQGVVVLVEGNTDALMAHQQGFENVVGSLGTALTAGQVELLTRYAPRIALAYDVDAAGQDAATFGLTELSALVGQIERSEYRGRLTDVDVVRLPARQDPDEVIRDDPDAWRTAVDNAQPIVAYLIDRHASRQDLRTTGGRERLVAALVPTLRTVSDPVRLDGYLLELSRRSGVDVRVLREALQRDPSRSRQSGRDGYARQRISLDAVMASPGALDPTSVERTLKPVESALLRMLLVRPDLIGVVRDRLSEGALVTAPARELWRALASAGDPFDRSAFLAGLDPTLETIARTLFARTDPLSDTEEGIRHALDQSLLTLEKTRLDDEVEFKRAEIADAEAAGDDAASDRLQHDVLDLQRRRLELDRQRATTTLLAKRRIHAIPAPTGGLT
jgi:DNA primase